MSRKYVYDLVKSGAVVGKYTSLFPLKGRYLVVPEYVNAHFGPTMKSIVVPLGVRVSDDGVTTTATIILDVTRKSQRQIDILLDLYGEQ